MKVRLRDMRAAAATSKRSQLSRGSAPVFVVGHPSSRADAEPGGTFRFAPNRSPVVVEADLSRPSVGVGLATGEVAGTVFVGVRGFPFTLAGLAPEDTIRADVVSNRRVVVSVVHAGARPPDCYARCPDGSQGRPCVTCDLGNGRSVRICC